MTPQIFTSHHIALSVRSLKESQDFYKLLGFMPILYWESDDDSLTIAHLRHSTGLILELFVYTSNATTPRVDVEVGNDLTQVGVKHIALETNDLQMARDALTTNGYQIMTSVARGRTEIDFFFVQDPDGMWVEVVRDNRVLNEQHPTHLRQTRPSKLPDLLNSHSRNCRRNQGISDVHSGGIGTTWTINSTRPDGASSIRFGMARDSLSSEIYRTLSSLRNVSY